MCAAITHRAKELRNAQRRKTRLTGKAKQLWDDDLRMVLVMRQTASGSKDKSKDGSKQSTRNRATQESSAEAEASQDLLS